jgi:hypothetical protein
VAVSWWVDGEVLAIHWLIETACMTQKCPLVSHFLVAMGGSGPALKRSGEFANASKRHFNESPLQPFNFGADPLRQQTALKK